MRVPRMPAFVRMSVQVAMRMPFAVIVPVRMSIPVRVFVRMDIPAAVLVRVAVFIVVHRLYYTLPLASRVPVRQPLLRSLTTHPRESIDAPCYHCEYQGSLAYPSVFRTRWPLHIVSEPNRKWLAQLPN